MAKQKLILVHGMGQHTPDTFKQEFIEVCEAALELYPTFEYDNIEDLFDIVSVGYNEIFDQHRQAMADRSKNMHDRSVAVGGASNVIAEMARKLADFENEFGGDGFFETHWLDVLFYRFTVLGERVRIKVGQAIASEIHNTAGGAADVHILAHSLGTAVVHDTLAKLYTPDYVLGDNTTNLSTTMHTLGSTHMVANVGRVLKSFVSVNESVVRPGACTAYYLQYRHRLDPITWPRPFTPTDNGGWISHAVWNQDRYLLKEPTSITRGNPHSLPHYLLNPLVHTDLFTLLFNFSPKASEKRKATALFQEMTLRTKAEQLEERLDNIQLSQPGSVRDLLKAAIELKNFVKGLGEDFNF